MFKPLTKDFICVNTDHCEILENQFIGHKDCYNCEYFEYSPDYTPDPLNKDQKKDKVVKWSS